MGSYDGAAGGHEFTLGAVFTRAIEIVSKQWPLAIGLSLVVGALNAATTGLFIETLAADSENYSLAMLSFLGPMAVSIFGVALLAALLTPRAVGHAFDDPNAVDGSAASLGGQLPAIFAAALMVTIATTVGYMFLLIPGIIMSIAWIATTPSIVVERMGAIEGMERSRDLTRGFRWPIFGVFVVIGLGQLLLGGLYYLLPGTDVNADPLGMFGMTLVDLVSGTISALIWAPMAIALYIELRLAKEGAPQSRYVEIFS